MSISELFDVEVFDEGGPLDTFGDPTGMSVMLIMRRKGEPGTYRISVRSETYHQAIGGDLRKRDQECARLFYKLDEGFSRQKLTSQRELGLRGLSGWASTTYRLFERTKVRSEWSLPGWLKKALGYATETNVQEAERRLAATWGAEIFIKFAEAGHITAYEYPHYKPHEHGGAAPRDYRRIRTLAAAENN